MNPPTVCLMSYNLCGLIVKKPGPGRTHFEVAHEGEIGLKLAKVQKKSRPRLLGERLSGGTVWIDLGL